MVNVRFFGMLRLDIKKSSIMIEAGSIEELLNVLNEGYEEINLNQLKNSIIFINDTNMNALKRYKTKLKDGDEVLFLSPVSGG